MQNFIEHDNTFYDRTRNNTRTGINYKPMVSGFKNIKLYNKGLNIHKCVYEFKINTECIFTEYHFHANVDVKH